MDDNIILNDVKESLGIAVDDSLEEGNTEFDNSLINCINTVFALINQMGIGPSKTFSINKSTKWSDFTHRLDMAPLKTYLYLKVKEIFDPSASGQIAQSQANIIKELEYRMHTLWDYYMKSDDPEIKSWIIDNS